MTAAPALLLGLLLASPGSAASEFLTNMRKGENVKEYPDKLEYFDRAVRAWLPGEDKALLAECRFRRGEALFHLWRFAEALADLSYAVDNDPANARARLLLARAELRLGRLEAAVKDARECTLIAPENPDGFLWLGEIFLRQDENAAALRAFSKAARLEGAGFAAWFGQGRAYVGLREWDKAQQALNDADGMAKGRSPEVLVELAVCAAGQGRHHDALEAYDRALPLFEARIETSARSDALAAESAEHRVEAGKAYFGRGRLEEFLTLLPEALADFQRACELGHEESCRRAEALAKKDVKPKPPPRLVEPKPEKKPKSKKKEIPNPGSDPGERIYAN